MNKPSLSIIMPVYNSGQFLSSAVKSVLEQSFQDFELIVINDGSTDNSRQVIQSFNDRRIVYLENERNSGIVFSRNKGLKKAKGSFIGMLDADDIAYRDKFEKQIRFLTENPDFGMVGSWVRFINMQGKRIRGGWKLKATPEEIPAIMLFKNYFLQSAVLYRKECLDNFSFSEGFDILEDYLIWYHILKKHKAWNLPEYLVDYRIHGEGVTKKHRQDRIEKEKRVFKIMFKDMGIDTTSEDLDLQMIIRNGDPIRDKETLLSIEQWLLKIVTRNNKMELYNKVHLKHIVANRWLKVCSKCRPLTPAIILTCFTSKLFFTFMSNYRPRKRTKLLW